MAVYREMEIGTAKPSPAERRSVPHHLIDVFSPDEECTAGDYSRLARKAIAGITARGNLPIVTGGTGLYLRALLDGLFAGPLRSPEMRDRLLRSAERRGPGWLHRLLARLDRRSAERIHANDTPKLIRAIEVCLAGRQPLSEAWQGGRDPLTGYRIVRIGLNPPRQELYERINERAERMFTDGLIEETRSLLDRYGEAPRAFDSLGYRQARAAIRGELSLEAAITAAQQGHRNYAKRQLTWFRKEPEVRWLEGFGDDAAIAAQAFEILEAEIR
jgi:tRNA dimethylallyltransferase